MEVEGVEGECRLSEPVKHREVGMEGRWGRLVLPKYPWTFIRITGR